MVGVCVHSHAHNAKVYRPLQQRTAHTTTTPLLHTVSAHRDILHQGTRWCVERSKWCKSECHTYSTMWRLHY